METQLSPLPAIKFLHAPAENNMMQALGATLRGIKLPTYGGYSVGYRIIDDGAQLEMSFAFCMNSDEITRDVFSKSEAREIIRSRFIEGETLKLNSLQLAPRCFMAPVSFRGLTSLMIETLVRTFAQENQTRLRHHVSTGFKTFVPDLSRSFKKAR